MRKKLMTALGVMAVGSAIVAAAAVGPAQRTRPASFKETLGLTDDQAAKLESLRAEFMKARIQHQAAVRVARLELAELMRANTIDEKAVQLKVKELGDLQAVGLKARIDHQLAVQKILTPEQRAKFRELRHRRGGQRMGRMGRRGMGPRGPMMGRGRMGAGPEGGPEMGMGPAADGE